MSPEIVIVAVTAILCLVMAAGMFYSQIKEKPLAYNKLEEEIHSYYCGCWNCTYTRLIAPEAENMDFYPISNDEE